MINAPSPLEGKRAAIIEDEGATQMQLRRALKQAGVQVVGSATNAEEGIDLVLDERPDFVLMDINMPGELSGLDAAEAIMSLYRVCIILLTAYSNDEYRWRAQDLPVGGYLIKPLASHALIPELEKAYTQWLQKPC